MGGTETEWYAVMTGLFFVVAAIGAVPVAIAAYVFGSAFEEMRLGDEEIARCEELIAEIREDREKARVTDHDEHDKE